jgi:broad specificity phosphatase PhoE
VSTVESINEPINILLVSHNSRIKCLLKSMDIDMMRYIGIEKKEIRFMNCAIIKLSISNINIKVSIHYNGQVEKHKKGYIYFIKNEEGIKEKENELFFEAIDINKNKYNDILKKLHINVDDIGNSTWDFYMMRHGEGLHNKLPKISGLISKLFKKDYLDPDLTPNGIDQAIKASASIQPIPFKIIFVSDLKRTRQTLANILPNITFDNITYNDETYKIPIYVLPCSHELNYIDSGLCDGNIMQKFQLTHENEMKANNANCENENKDPDCVINDHPLNWYYYKEFYGSNKRGTDNNPNREHCKNTSMISIGLMIYKNAIENKTHNLIEWINNHKYV